MKRLLFSLFLFCTCCFSQLHAQNEDLWHALTASFKLPEATNNVYVRQQISWIKSHPGYIKDFVDQSEPYIHYILEEVKRRNLPGEVALIPMIESNYDPHAYSHVGAAGLWQLMPQTGSGLGVIQNQWFDGRRDVEMSTKAALNYVEYLNRFFGGQWLPVFAAYDSGEGTVQRAYQRVANKNFWALPLPAETQRYVPRILALASVIRHPQRYHIQLPAKAYHSYFTEVTITQPINLHQAAEFADISYEALLKLNPAHNQWTTAPGQSSTLLVPLNKASNFQQAYATYQAKGDAYRVKRGDALSIIAQQHQTSVATIMTLNHLTTKTIRIGQTLALPPPHLLAKAYRADVKRQAAIVKGQKRGPTQVFHQVSTHDTLASISQHYHVKSTQVVFWNQLKSTQLSPKQTLTIWLPSGTYASANTYRVKNGDTLSGIALKHHTSVKHLVALNPKLKNSKYIRNHQLLVVNA